MRNLSADDPVVEAAIFGKEVENFLQSNIGKHLVRCADEQQEDAVEKLISQAHEMTHEQILAVQSDIKRAREIKDWLAQAIIDGVQALNMLEGEQ